MKQVGMVSSTQFGHIYIGGIPYDPAKVKRFVSKGLGIRVHDIVIFEADEDRTLSYIKNAVYMDSVDEKKMVKDFVRTSEMNRARMSEFVGIDKDIRKQLAEEGIVIHGGKVELCPAINDLPEVTEMEFNPEIDFDPEVLRMLTPDQKRTLSIILQSSLKISADVVTEDADLDTIKKIAKDLTEWIDRNSTGILTSEYIQKVAKK